MKKKIELVIENCSQCPYCEYDPNYGRSYDSGYDCKKDGNRIIDDWAWDNTNNPNRLNKKYDFIPMPDWCPLEDYSIKDERKEKLERLIK